MVAADAGGDIRFVTPRSKEEAAALVARSPSVLVFADIDASGFSGSTAELANLLLDWQQAGLAGFRILPGDLLRVTRELVPELQRRGVFRDHYEAGTLRGLLGLPRPANRYASGAPA